MPFHMNYSPIGFEFSDYEAYRPITSIRVNQVLQQAMAVEAASRSAARPVFGVQPPDERGIV